MRRIWTSGPLAVAVALAVSGCATKKEKMLPHDDTTMLDIWNQETGGGARASQNDRRLLDARQSLRRPLTRSDVLDDPVVNASYTRKAQTEIYSQFYRLPNPDLAMYVFPHLAGADPVPVPGYTTVFPLYHRVQYAMPGERTEEF